MNPPTVQETCFGEQMRREQMYKEKSCARSKEIRKDTVVQVSHEHWKLVLGRGVQRKCSQIKWRNTWNTLHFHGTGVQKTGVIGTSRQGTNVRGPGEQEISHHLSWSLSAGWDTGEGWPAGCWIPPRPLPQASHKVIFTRSKQKDVQKFWLSHRTYKKHCLIFICLRRISSSWVVRLVKLSL